MPFTIVKSGVGLLALRGRFRSIRRFDESGATSIEYALIVSGIALAIISAVGVLGEQVTDTFDSYTNQVEQEKTKRGY
ncbi:MAG: Flp family type IVb pilin [Magnetospiraceae bacterium]